MSKDNLNLYETFATPIESIKFTEKFKACFDQLEYVIIVNATG